MIVAGGEWRDKAQTPQQALSTTLIWRRAKLFTVSGTLSFSKTQLFRATSHAPRASEFHPL